MLVLPSVSSSNPHKEDPGGRKHMKNINVICNSMCSNPGRQSGIGGRTTRQARFAHRRKDWNR
eukprot:3866438-Alexandrium_andersonii.AAC.1